MSEVVGAGRVGVVIGQVVRLVLPWSEVCMHLRLAGHARAVRLTDEGMAQILDDDGREVSFPILANEAGFYGNAADGYYVHSWNVQDGMTLNGGFREVAVSGERTTQE